jgi:hypothetical protein
MSTATRVAAGASSRKSSSRLAVNSELKKLTPVRLPPGRASLATRPSLTGKLSARVATLSVPQPRGGLPLGRWWRALQSDEAHLGCLDAGDPANVPRLRLFDQRQDRLRYAAQNAEKLDHRRGAGLAASLVFRHPCRVQADATTLQDAALSAREPDDRAAARALGVLSDNSRERPGPDEPGDPQRGPEVTAALAAAMPPWDEIDLAWDELRVLPSRWRAALSQWRGIYYIFDQAAGKGYVGSAYGDANLLGRWVNYSGTGHGGNTLLRQRDPRNFRFTILQRVSPDMDAADVIRLEGTWKERLHTRQPFGLNDN